MKLTVAFGARSLSARRSASEWIMNALVLGAGASKAYVASPTTMTMPLAREVFSTFSKLDISGHPWVLIGNILNYARDTRGVNVMEVFKAGYDIEEFHSDVEARLLAALSRYRDEPDLHVGIISLMSVYTQLVFFFASVVNEIQNGPRSEAHCSLAKRLQPTDAVITFNWDTLMDRALAETTSWTPDGGYGFCPRKVFRDAWIDPLAVSDPSVPVLLKLHGSTNWVTSYLSVNWETQQFELLQQSTPDTVWVYHFANQAYPAFAGRYMPGYQPFSMGYYPPNLLDDPGKSAGPGHLFVRARPKWPLMPEGTGDDRGVPSMPLIIPPVKEKAYHLFGSLFTSLWKRAEDALASADQITLIGYSFPRTDHQSIRVFQKAFTRRSTIPRVVLVNPDPRRPLEVLTRDLGVSESMIDVAAEPFGDGLDLDRVL